MTQPNAEHYEHLALEQLRGGHIATAQIHALLAISQRLADMQRDQTYHDLLLERPETREDRLRDAPDLGGVCFGQSGDA